MPLSIDFVECEEHTEMIVSGSYELHDAVSKFALAISKCEMTGKSLVLVDSRAMTGRPMATEQIIYAHGIIEQYQQHLEKGGQPLRIAFLRDSSRPIDYEPGLEISRQNRIPFELFTKRQDALSWLGVSEA
jgi:hypothetical protein